MRDAIACTKWRLTDSRQPDRNTEKLSTSRLNERIGLLTGQSVPIFIQVVSSFLISARILMRRLESLRRRLRVVPIGRVRRNISMTC